MSCVVYFSSTIKQYCAYYGQNRQMQFFFAPSMEFKLRAVGVSQKIEFSLILRCRLNDLID